MQNMSEDTTHTPVYVLIMRQQGYITSMAVPCPSTPSCNSIKVFVPPTIGPRPCHGTSECPVCRRPSVLSFEMPCEHDICWPCVCEWSNTCDVRTIGLSCPICKDCSIRGTLHIGDTSSVRVLRFTIPNQPDELAIVCNVMMACFDDVAHFPLPYIYVDVIAGVEDPEQYDTTVQQKFTRLLDVILKDDRTLSIISHMARTIRP